MSKSRKGLCFLSGRSLIRRQWQWRSLRSAGIVDTKTFLQLDLDHVSYNSLHQIYNHNQIVASLIPKAKKHFKITNVY